MYRPNEKIICTRISTIITFTNKNENIYSITNYIGNKQTNINTYLLSSICNRYHIQLIMQSCKRLEEQIIQRYISSKKTREIIISLLIVTLFSSICHPINGCLIHELKILRKYHFILKTCYFLNWVFNEFSSENKFNDKLCWWLRRKRIIFFFIIK